jgi:osmotically-inducible protein OsmY
MRQSLSASILPQIPMVEWRTQMSDRTLKQAVEDELEWEPSIDAEHIGVTAEDGVVTLSAPGVVSVEDHISIV